MNIDQAVLAFAGAIDRARACLSVQPLVARVNRVRGPQHDPGRLYRLLSSSNHISTPRGEDR